MRKNETKVLKALLEHPRTSDRKIANMLRISQPTVTRIRSRLVSGGVLTFSSYPNLAALGYQSILFTEIFEDGEDKALRSQLVKDNSVVFVAKQLNILFTISIHRTHASYKRFNSKYPVITQIDLSPNQMKMLMELNFARLINDTDIK